jgi:hypothetical protein
MTPELIGREAEITAVERFLDIAVERRAALVIAGEAGIGKSVLWREAIGRAEGRGWHIARANPAEAETQDAYAGLTDLLGSTFEAIRSGLPRPLEGALAAALLVGTSQPLTDSRATSAATVAALDRLAEDRNVLLAIDDAQWLDVDSARAVAFAARRTVPRVSFLVTHRADDASVVPLGLDRAVLPDHIVRVMPAPLSRCHPCLPSRPGDGLSPAGTGRHRR